jgi:pyridoxamine 5'-phosphate oxidase
MALVQQWLDDAVREAGQRNPAAMTLATSNGAGRVSARMVLLKGVAAEGYGHFFTHYESRKATDLAALPWAAGVLHWDRLGRQIRLEGPVTRATAEDSDRYFASRPWRSQLNAWASRQSQARENLSDLDRRAQYWAREFGLPDPLDPAAPEEVAAIVPRPSWWGGFKFWFAAVELWLEGESRFHDRIRFERTLQARQDKFIPAAWTCQYLQP